MRSYRHKAPYVRGRFDPGGEELNGQTLDDIDPSDMHGYADLWKVPPDPDGFVLIGRNEQFALADPQPQLTLPRVEPHQNPPWLEPAGSTF